MNSDKLLNFYESRLGTFKRVSKFNSIDYVSLLEFNNQPIKGTKSYLTFGLSNHILTCKNKKVRIEFIFCSSNKTIQDGIIGFMEDLSNSVLTSHESPLSGQTILSPRKFPNKDLCYLYFCAPVIYHEDIFLYKDGTDEVICIWCFPIYEREYNLVNKKGWSVFESLLEKKSPNLYDINRTSVI